MFMESWKESFIVHEDYFSPYTEFEILGSRPQHQHRAEYSLNRNALLVEHRRRRRTPLQLVAKYPRILLDHGADVDPIQEPYNLAYNVIPCRWIVCRRFSNSAQVRRGRKFSR